MLDALWAFLSQDQTSTNRNNNLLICSSSRMRKKYREIPSRNHTDISVLIKKLHGRSKITDANSKQVLFQEECHRGLNHTWTAIMKLVCQHGMRWLSSLKPPQTFKKVQKLKCLNCEKTLHCNIVGCVILAYIIGCDRVTLVFARSEWDEMASCLSIVLLYRIRVFASHAIGKEIDCSQSNRVSKVDLSSKVRYN